jgi:DNA-binding NarL/FixJ family response regulator
MSRFAATEVKELCSVKVVLVDDSRDIQTALTRLLATLPGVQVAGCAEDVAGALQVIEASRPDIVVLDVGLRGQDRGIDVLRRVAADHPDIDVIVLSNFAWDAMREAFIAAGARAYFDKALEFDKVRDWVRARMLDLEAPPRSAGTAASPGTGPAGREPGRVR